MRAARFLSKSIVLLAELEIIRTETQSTMERISRYLLGSFVLLMMMSQQDAIAGCCGPRGCNFTYPPAPVQRAPAATASSKHGFTATGGSRVAQINLSQEALDVIKAAGEEEPLPKGFVTAADREKLIAKQASLYEWPENEISQSSVRAQSRYYIAKPRNSRTRVLRNPSRQTKPATSVKVAIAAKSR